MARLMADLSQQQVAEQIGVSRMAISKYENNRMVPSSDVLVGLAEALGQPVEFFLRGISIPSVKPVYPGRECLQGKREEMIVAQVQEWVERSLATEALFPPEEIPAFTKPQTFPRQISSLEDIESAAEELRKSWNLGNAPIANLTELLEEQGIKVGLVNGDEEFDTCLFALKDGTPVIAVQRDMAGERQRFGLARELSHLLLEPAGDLDAEKAANRFARAFLAPSDSAVYELGSRRRHLSIHELHLLKHRYGLSMQAWIQRAAELGILDENEAAKLFRQFRRNHWHIEEPGDPLPPEYPQRMVRLILRALAEDIISRSRAEELLGMTWAEFARDQRQQHGDVPIAVRA